ncbi:ligand-binding sensor domain-containing protein [Algoriphagus hitonicola]|uniref:ligand-binding sensor domain-containing protein n=1 Tax=Algoriphagus hitonicola TaxID=435880 RepID=UPI0036113EE5
MLLLVFYSIPNFWDTGYSFAQAEQNSDSAADFSLDYVMEIWDNTKGLPQNAVFALEKDNHGYLWIATEEGLVRFDGTYPKVFDQDNYPEMIEQTYYTFFKTPGGLWATADRSVALLEKNIQKVIDCTSITENTWIRAITQIENGDLLIGTEEGKIHRWANETFTPLDFWNPELGLEIQSFFHWSPSQLMVGTTRGLYLLDLDAEEVKLLSSDTFPVIKIFGSSSVVYVYSPDAGIFQLMENMEMKSIISFNEINDINPSSLVSDSENRIWAGSIEKGIILIENGKVNRFSYPELENYTIRKIIKEDENLYLGTLGKGLALVKPAKVTQPKFKALDKKNIKPIFQAADSSVWIGTRSDGIFWIEDGKIRNLNESNGLIQNGITTIGAKDEKIYAGTTVGISIIDRNSGKIISEFTKEDGLKHNYITAIYKDSKDWVWILTRRGGIHYIDENEVFHQIDLPENFAFTNFVTIKELRNKEILIGSMNQGIFRFKDGEFIGNRTLPLTPGEDVVYAIYEDKVGDLWFATHGGLILLKDGRFKVLRKANGLKTKSVYSITHDGINGVWISNNFGVQYFSDSELEKFKETRDEDFFIGTTLYNESLGMPNSEANGLIFPPVTKDFSGKIWVPTVEGVGVIDPAVTSEQAKSPSNFIWDELQLGNQKAAIDSQIEIPPGFECFRFLLASLTSKTPLSILFSTELMTDRRVGYQSKISDCSFSMA